MDGGWGEAGERGRCSVTAPACVVVVIGGRHFANQAGLFMALDDFHAKNRIGRLHHGNANGADALADAWATARGVPVQPWDAMWTIHGRSAGPKRNRDMLEGARPACVIAFPGGRGTANCVQTARTMGIPVWEPYGR